MVRGMSKGLTVQRVFVSDAEVEVPMRAACWPTAESSAFVAEDAVSVICVPTNPPTREKL
jgi:hypothetical protein